MKIIALLGNPNSGKTSIFNLLTGSNQQVGNWPGVTVEKNLESIEKIKMFVFKIYRVSTPSLLTRLMSKLPEIFWSKPHLML
ncbi:hypothetical protein RU89_GL000070 [Lactococcus cremoris]|nr:Ferrous iron transport protein B [Lactococcus cremoris]KZK42504.1 Ferrous iron transport protein B [Lactococcus cremoris]PCS20310.1 hypothetical protein RU89_GL000070 [Lactococcus cremoris]